MTNDDNLLTPDTVTEWLLPRDPQMAPDGRNVLFTLAAAARPDEHDRASIQLLDIPTKEVRQFTSGPRLDASPRWSPDGTSVAFLSDRETPGIKELFLMPAHGGEASRLATAPGGITDLAWSPDGSLLAYAATDPKSADEQQDEKERRDQTVRDRNLKPARLYVIPPHGGEPRLISRSGAEHVVGFDWLPDGSGLVVLYYRGPRVDDGYGPSTFTICPVAGETAEREICTIAPGAEQPRVSPDGSTIAFRSKAGRVTTNDQIWVLPTDGGQPRLVTAGYAGTIDFIVWAPDGRGIRFVAYEDLWGALRSVDIGSGDVTSLLPPAEDRNGSYDPYFTQDAAGDRFAVIRHSSACSPQVWVGTAGGTIEQYTDLNSALSCLPYATGEPIHWASTDGYEISGLLFRPVGFEAGRLYPLVVHIHGGPNWLWSDRFVADWHDWAQPLAQRGYAVLLPNPRGSTGRGAEFIDAEVNDMGGGELRDILTGVDHVVGLGFVDPERLGVGGWSHGGYMTAWTITQTDRFKCAVMGAGLSNLASDQGQNDIPRCNDEFWDVSVYEDPEVYLGRSAITHMRHVRTPTLIAHGEKDERVHVAQSYEMYRGLQWAGVETELVTYPREGHLIEEREHQRDLLGRVLGWFDRYLKEEAH